MKRLLIGAAIGVAAIYLIKKCKQYESLEEFLDEAKLAKIKAKKQIRNTMDHIHNEGQYIGERIENETSKLKRKISK